MECIVIHLKYTLISLGKTNYKAGKRILLSDDMSQIFGIMGVLVGWQEDLAVKLYKWLKEQDMQNKAKEWEGIHPKSRWRTHV